MKERGQEQKRGRNLPYILGAAVIAVTVALGTYFLLKGWLGLRPSIKETAVRQQIDAPIPGEKKENGNKENHERPVAMEGTKALIVLSPEEKTNIGLKTEAAAIRTMEDIRKINGIVIPHPDKVALVTSRVAGKAVGIHVNLGELVRQGEDLADIQSVDLEKTELDLIQAENRLDLTKAELDRVRGLVEKGISARKDLIAAENQYKSELNEIDSLTRQLMLLGLSDKEITRLRGEKKISTLHLKAPISGTIVERNVILGQTVEPNTNLFKVLDTTTMIAEGEAFEDIVPLLREGQKVRVTVTPYPGKVFQGKIIFISPTVEHEKRTAHLWVEVENHHGMLKEGFFAKLFVVIRAESKALTIPVESLMSDQGEDFIFVEKEGGYARVDLNLGIRNDLYVEVKRGLKPGDHVVTEGKQQLHAKYLSASQGEAALGGHGH